MENLWMAWETEEEFQERLGCAVYSGVTGERAAQMEREAALWLRDATERLIVALQSLTDELRRKP